ncbi:MAG: hypothetical protein QOF10_1674 [Kribbellaceae bacterium]|nr:hypothetical protein [Kribbellaceae bacterium]
MDGYTIKALGESTWDDFAAMVERNAGLFSGCWCAWFHAQDREEEEPNRPYKQRMVRDGVAHAALVFEGDEAVAWAEYGTPEELPNIHHRKQYDESAVTTPDYRITCIYVDKRHRRSGLAALALRGALDLIARAGVAGSRATRRTRRAGRSTRHSCTTAPGTCTRRPASPTTARRARTTA